MKTTTADNIETKSARHGAAKNFRLTIGTVERGQFKKVIEFDPSSARVELKMGVHAVLVGPLDAPVPVDYFNGRAQADRLSSQIHRSDFSLAIIKDGELVKITPPPLANAA
jgi:hypothetical protein